MEEMAAAMLQDETGRWLELKPEWLLF